MFPRWRNLSEPPYFTTTVFLFSVFTQTSTNPSTLTTCPVCGSLFPGIELEVDPVLQTVSIPGGKVDSYLR